MTAETPHTGRVKTTRCPGRGTERLQDLAGRVDRLETAVQCLALERPDCVERARLGDSRYELRAFRLTAPHGGILVVIHRVRGQRRYVCTIDYLDNYAAQVGRSWGTAYGFTTLAVAVDHILDTRRERLDALAAVEAK